MEGPKEGVINNTGHTGNYSYPIDKKKQHRVTVICTENSSAWMVHLNVVLFFLPRQFLSIFYYLQLEAFQPCFHIVCKYVIRLERSFKCIVLYFILPIFSGRMQRTSWFSIFPEVPYLWKVHFVILGKT